VEATSFDPLLLADRIQRALERLAREHRLPYPVSISCGTDRFDPSTTPIEVALRKADAAMYEVKRTHRAGRLASHGPSPRD
jgi:GGDEF domain-containing protein